MRDHRFGRGRGRWQRSGWWFAALVGPVTWMAPADVLADAFSAYSLTASFSLPAGAGPIDVLPDGRIVGLVGSEVIAESAANSRSFGSAGMLAGADFSSFGAGFLQVSPDGSRIAVGNGGGASFGNYRVGVFDLSGLAGNWLAAEHFSAAWADATHLALTAGAFGSPAYVSLLNTASASVDAPDNPIIINNVGGASGGVAFDTAGNLYTGNGFAITGPSGTGAVKHFAQADWMTALALADPLDFEAEGTLVVDVLSAAALGFDSEGNLHVGGGDFGGAEVDFAALVRGSAIADALGGLGAADILDTAQVRRLDPDAAGSDSYYTTLFNDATGELYVRDGGTVYVYTVPEPMSATLMALGLLGVVWRARSAREGGAA